MVERFNPTQGTEGQYVRYSEIAPLERQIAELRAERDHLLEVVTRKVNEKVAAEAENARLRALPLKDEVERVLDALITDILSYEKINALAPNPGKRYCWQSVENAVALLPRLRTGEQEGWRSQAADDVLAERQRQVEDEGWSFEHDDSEHCDGQLAIAAACYAISAGTNDGNRHLLRAGRWTLYEGNLIITAVYWLWSLTIKWSTDWWKPSSRRRDLVKSAALIIAEIERLDRAASPSASDGGSRNG